MSNNKQRSKTEESEEEINPDLLEMDVDEGDETDEEDFMGEDVGGSWKGFDEEE